MSYEMIALLMFASMTLLLLTGQRVFAAIGFVAAGAALLLYGNGAVEMPFNQVFKLFNWYAMLTLPMFIYMGYILSESGIAEDLYKMLHVWFGRIRGRPRHRHDPPDGHHLGDERPVGRGHGHRRDHRAAGNAAARLRQGADLGRRAGRIVARHPDPAVASCWCSTA